MSEVIQRDDLWIATCIRKGRDRITSQPMPFWQIHIRIGEQYEAEPEIHFIQLNRKETHPNGPGHLHRRSPRRPDPVFHW